MPSNDIALHIAAGIEDGFDGNAHAAQGILVAFEHPLEGNLRGIGVIPGNCASNIGSWYWAW